MHTLANIKEIEPTNVKVTRDTLTIQLADGRTVSAPTHWFPRLAHGTRDEWANFELMYDGVHWPDLNEDISIAGLLRGEKSGESLESIKRWLGYRARGEKEPIPELPLSPEFRRELEKLGVLKSKPKKSKPRPIGSTRKLTR